ncbi:hypothetical protein FRC19_005175 [Serendipita sp. 401]|nr:hypothetical protein FRC19_005175 [Serendipita sp. 401]
MSVIQLLFSENYVRHTVITCESLGIRYEALTHCGTVSVYRRDAVHNWTILVGEFKLPEFSRDKVKLPVDQDWKSLKRFLYRHCFLSSSWSFIDNDGIEYRWKKRRGVLNLYGAHRHREPLAEFHRHYAWYHPSHLNVLDPSIVNSQFSR